MHLVKKLSSVWYPRKKKNKRKRIDLAKRAEDQRKFQSHAGWAKEKLQRFPTPAEKELIAALNDLNVKYKFQRSFYDHTRACVVDFYFPRIMRSPLVVELDGSSHDSDGARWKDWNRTVFLTSKKGCKVIRFRNEQIFNDLSGVVRAIQSYGLIYETIQQENCSG